MFVSGVALLPDFQIDVCKRQMCDENRLVLDQWNYQNLIHDSSAMSSIPHRLNVLKSYKLDTIVNRRLTIRQQ